jgi:hypothetical protein
MEFITVGMGFEFVAGVVFIASGFSHEANFVLMIVGVPDENFIEKHDDHEGDHGDDHGQWKFALVQTGGIACCSALLLEVTIEVLDGFWNHIDHGDGKEEST